MVAVLRKRLLIECPTQYRSLSSDPDCDFEYFQSKHYLKLWCSGTQYGEVRDYGGESTPVIWTLGTPTTAVRSFKRAIEYSSGGDEPKWRLDVIRLIVAGTLSPSLSYRSAIEIVDFVLPEPLDEAAARSGGYEAFTKRNGVLSEPKAGGGAIGSGFDSFIKGGLKFRFDELKTYKE
jgi:hypothetical protein